MRTMGFSKDTNDDDTEETQNIVDKPIYYNQGTDVNSLDKNDPHHICKLIFENMEMLMFGLREGNPKTQAIFDEIWSHREKDVIKYKRKLRDLYSDPLWSPF